VVRIAGTWHVNDGGKMKAKSMKMSRVNGSSKEFTPAKFYVTSMLDNLRKR